MSTTLTLVLPAHNEAGNIERVVASFLDIRDQIDLALTILIVDDGSTDGTGPICRNLAENDPAIRCVHHSRNVGYGGALISGFRASEGDYVALSDADGQFHPADLIRLLEHIESYDAVVGYRQERADPPARRFMGRAWSLLGRWFFKIPIRDLNCGLKIFKRSSVADLPLQCVGPGINLELMTHIVTAGIPIKEVPCAHFPRVAGDQSGGTLRVMVRALPELAHVWRLKRGKGPCKCGFRR
ncbi:MAG: glycosyltransferase family 2 protein [Thermodesulfobacteriota bacterium]